MKITGAAFLFLANEAHRSFAFSSYLQSLSGPSNFAKSSYGEGQNQPVETSQRNDFESDISGPQSVLKAPTYDYLGLQQQPAPTAAAGGVEILKSSSGVDYLNSLASSRVGTTKHASYTGFNSKPKAVNSGSSYLTGLTGASPIPTHTAAPSIGAYQQPQSDAALLPVQAFSKPDSYCPFGSKPQAVESGGSYLSNLNGASTVHAETPSSSPYRMTLTEVASSGSLGNLAGATQTSREYPIAAVADATTASVTRTAVTSSPSNYSPFGSKPRAVVESGYLGNLRSAASSPTISAPSAAAPTTVAAPATSATSSSTIPSSYSPFGSKPKAIANTGYLANLASASTTTTVSAPAATAPAATTMTQSNAIKQSSYSPFGSKPKAVQETGYLAGLSGTAAFSTSPPAPTTSTPAAMQASSSVRSVEYSPFGSKPKAVANTGYLGSLGGTQLAVSVATHAQASPAPVEGQSRPINNIVSYSPFGTMPKAVATTGYLGSVASAGATPILLTTPRATEATASPTSESPRQTSYSPYGCKPKVVAETGYLGGLVASTSATGSTMSATVASIPVVSPQNAKLSSYSPFGSMPKAVANTGYLGSLSSASVSSSVIAPHAAAVSVPQVTASGPMTTLQSSHSSYSPFGAKPKAVAESGYLGGLAGASTSNTIFPLVSSASSAAALVSAVSQPSAKPSNYSPFGAKPQAVASAGYLGKLSGATASSTSAASVAAGSTPPARPPLNSNSANKPSSFSPFGAKPRAPESHLGGYLGGLSGATTSVSATAVAPAASFAPPAPTSTAASAFVAAPGPASYSPFGAKPRAPESQQLGGYLSGLTGATPLPSSTTTAALFAPPPVEPTRAPQLVVPSSSPSPPSFSGFGAKPKVVATGGYLGSL